jgi:hypothetical protein
MKTELFSEIVVILFYMRQCLKSSQNSAVIMTLMVLNMPQTLDNIKLRINVRHTDFNVNNSVSNKSTNQMQQLFKLIT